jgi:apolipoprotein N-acyltransferase
MNREDLKICLVTGLLLTLSFPPFPSGFLAPIALAIFLNHIIQKNSRSAFLLGYVKGVIWASLTLFWIGRNTIPGVLIVIFVSPLQYAITWWIFRNLYRKSEDIALWTFPFIWVTGEFLRHFSELRFNWLNIAYTQTYYTPFIQFIEITGYLGIALLIGYLTIFFHRIFYLKIKILINAIILALLVIIPIIYGLIRINELKHNDYPLIRVGVVQPNVDPFQKWDIGFQDSAFQILKQSTLFLSDKKLDLVVWPETATPFYLRLKGMYLNQIYNLTNDLQTYLITGTPDLEYSDTTSYKTFNAAFFFSPGDYRFGKYYKMALVPAAETMPFKDWLPFLREIDVGGGDFFQGDEYTVFKMNIGGREEEQMYEKLPGYKSRPDSVNVATIICFESIFPHLVRRFVLNGANLLTIITNDGWFGKTSGPFQHAQYAAFRAIENRVSIARSANTGISCFIDLTGKIYDNTKLVERTTIYSELAINKNLTLYTRYGDWLGIISLIMTVPLAVYSLLRGK